MASSPMSPLSSLSSDELPEDVDHETIDDYEDLGAMPPAKRRRTTKSTRISLGYESPSMVLPDAKNDWTDVSSDTTGSVPGTPRAMKDSSMADEESIGVDQVRNCSWDGCKVGGLANVDELVAHLNEDHVGPAKRTKFTCEWSDCKAKGKTQMSAYALKAHLRSHTKEKPFYCLLPECDRSFTRSDALAKHMRTVHETESSRTMEHYGKPVPTEATPPAQTQPAKPPARLKLVLSSNKISSPSTQHHNAVEENESNAPLSPVSPSKRDEVFGPLPQDLLFTEDEAHLPRNELFRLLRRQVHWAQQESNAMQQELSELNKRRKHEWMRKELVFENALEAEYERLKRKGIVGDIRSRGLGRDVAEEALLPLVISSNDEQRRTRRLEGKRVVDTMAKDASLATHLPMNGQKRPWYRDPQWKNQEDVGANSPDDDEKASKENDSGKEEADPDDEGEPGDDDTEIEELEDGA